MLLAGELTEQVIGLAIEVRRYASTWPHRHADLARLMVMAMHRNCATEKPQFFSGLGVVQILLLAHRKSRLGSHSRVRFGETMPAD